NREAISWVQKTLKKQGAYLAEFTPPHMEVMDSWAYPGLKVVRGLGLAGGGYNNYYGLDEAANGWTAQSCLNVIFGLLELKTGGAYEEITDIPENAKLSDLVVAAAFGLTGEHMILEEALSYLTEKGLLDAAFLTHVGNWQDVPTVGHIYYLAGMIYEKAF
ncbi:MAG: hypothetical protein FWE85_05715, partial [Clostridiales bacterium]|nr:hypothetical protein [Clostridiales bacterium]